MLLKSLKLKDFRQFKGEQEITISTDPIRNVTVIMGENGSGKTTLAQAFTWCLYGDTDFDDKSMLCKATAQSMLPGNEEKVRVELALKHNNIEYLCIREQLYSKDNSGSIRRHNQTTFKIAYKNTDGQREYVPDGETELRMKEILPKELSKYFFFDGERRETERKELSLKDENNRKIEVYKAYAQYMHTILLSLYQEKETETRQQLEQTVNEIFKSIYNGGFSLSIDEKYNIQVIVNEFEGVNEDVETSTAQSISVIFAFIAGVIKMARQSQNPENEMLVSEPYPLVMDAPLSAFDKTRIRTVCDALPKVAEQVIIFIKDTDGELAETYMGDKVGRRFEFDKKNEFETNLVTR